MSPANSAAIDSANASALRRGVHTLRRQTLFYRTVATTCCHAPPQRTTRWCVARLSTVQRGAAPALCAVKRCNATARHAATRYARHGKAAHARCRAPRRCAEPRFARAKVAAWRAGSRRTQRKGVLLPMRCRGVTAAVCLLTTQQQRAPSNEPQNAQANSSFASTGFVIIKHVRA